LSTLIIQPLFVLPACWIYHFPSNPCFIKYATELKKKEEKKNHQTFKATAMARLTPQVRIVEVGPRDGLQSIKDAISTETKVQLIQRLHGAGLGAIELTSVVSPRRVPQLADCQQVLADPVIRELLAADREDLRLPVLVPNTRGLDVAISHGVKEVAVFICATEGFSKANINGTVQQGIERARRVARKAIDSGIAVRGYVLLLSYCLTSTNALA
jgi:isopropylmalate/homocitrate/citramalate synthase